MRVKIFCDDGSVVDYFLTKTTTARQLSEEIAKIKCAQSPKAMANVLSVTISQGKGKSVAYISPDVVLDEAVSSIVKGQEEQINGKSKMNGVDNYISGDIKISVLGLKTMDAQQKLQTIKELTLQLKAIGGRLEHAVYNLNGEGKVMDVDVNPVTSKFEDVSEAPVQSAVAAAPTAVLALPSTGMRTNKSIISEIERKIAAFIKEILESVDQLDKRGKHSIFAAKGKILHSFENTMYSPVCNSCIT